MPLQHCDFADCSMSVERDYGSCMICSTHRCTKHLAQEYHSCPSEASDSDAFFAAYDSAKEKHLLAVLAKVDFARLAALSSRLRGNIECTLPATRAISEGLYRTCDLRLVSDKTGGQNCHLDVLFADGVEWIARLRLQDPTHPPSRTQRHILDGEIGTLQFLADKTQVPVPKVFHHSVEPIEIGTPFILMEKLPGSPLQWNTASPEQKTKIMEQLVDAFLELERHPFTKLGSPSLNGSSVGPQVQHHMFFTPTHSVGPYDTLGSSLRAIEEHELDMIENGELSTLAVDNYLTHLWRLERIPELEQIAMQSSFYIKHFDDNGDHILVDEDYKITGIIDWEFASTECAQMAFSSPCMMWPVADFYDGSNRLSAEEIEFAAMFRQRGRDDMAQSVLKGRKSQRFSFFLGSRVSVDRKEFEALFQGLREAFDGPKYRALCGLEKGYDRREV